jgi:excisionase family DNA binding protein
MDTSPDPVDSLDLVGPAELAALLKVTRNTVRRMVLAGTLPPPRLLGGRRPRWRRVELESWWTSQPRAGAGRRAS